MVLLQGVITVIESLEVHTISGARKAALQPLVNYIKGQIAANKAIRLNFICTHNSRRSHLSQIWAQTMAAYYHVNGVSCYSGGTEATAMFPKVGDTLITQGFNIAKLSNDNNPVYSIKFSANEPAIIAFSKTFNSAFNPASGFAAIMTCASANAGCPMVFGCDTRIAITYEDPKKSDGTPQQTATYLSRSVQIAQEMKFVFSSVVQ